MNPEEEVVENVDDQSNDGHILKIKQEPSVYTEDEVVVTELGNNMEIASTDVDTTLDTSQLEQVMAYSQIGHDNGTSFTIVGDVSRLYSSQLLSLTNT